MQSMSISFATDHVRLKRSDDEPARHVHFMSEKNHAGTGAKYWMVRACTLCEFALERVSNRVTVVIRCATVSRSELVPVEPICNELCIRASVASCYTRTHI